MAAALVPAYGLADIDPTKLPDEMKALPVWNVWRLQSRKGGGKPTKIPLSIHTGRPHNVQDTEHLGTLEQAMEAAERFQAQGVGFSFIEGCGFVGLDFDNCVKDGVLHPAVSAFIEQFSCYCEISPSGTGVKIWMKADVAFAERNRLSNFLAPGVEMEMYSWGRYFTVTSQRIDALSNGMADQTELMERLYRDLMKKAPNSTTTNKTEPSNTKEAVDLSDQELLEAAFANPRNGADIAALYRGDTGQHGGDHSRADQALNNHLAYLTGKDADRMDRMFRSSGLFRPEKWDRVHVRGETYGAATIANAIAITDGVYTPYCERNDDEEEKSAKAAEVVPEPWGEMNPLRSETLPPFYLEVFAPWIRNYLEAVTRTLQTPPDFAGMFFLGGLALAFQKRFRLTVKPGWEEPLPLWILVAAPSGSKKSQAFRLTMKPFNAWQNWMKEEFATVRRDATRRIKTLTAEIEELKRKKASGHLIGEKEEELAELFVPPTPRLFTGSGTPEAIESKLEEHFGRYALASAESDILSVLMGKYRSGGSPPIEGFLSGWSGEDLRNDFQTREDVDVTEAHLSMVLASQNENVDDLYGQKKLGGRGCYGRLLTTLPETEDGDEWTTEQVPSQVESAYLDGVGKLLPSFEETLKTYCETRKVEPIDLHFGREALAVFRPFFERIQKRRKVGGDMQFLEEWSAKVCGQCARISALLHLSDYPGDTPDPEVSSSAVERAVYLTEQYLIPHAKAVFGSAVTQQTEKVWSVLRSFDKAEIPRKELIRAVRPLPANELQSILDLLEEQGFVKVETRPSPNSKRPPSFVILNPKAPEVLGSFGSFGTCSEKPVMTPFKPPSKNGTYSELNGNFIPPSPPVQEDPNKFRLSSKTESSPEASADEGLGISSISSKRSIESEVNIQDVAWDDVIS